MLQGAPIGILVQTAGFLGNQYRPALMMHILEARWVHFMLRHQIRLAELASQVVLGDRVSERKRRRRALLTEDHHIGELDVVLRCDFFAEDAA